MATSEFIMEDRNLALWFTPDAIKDHFEGDDDVETFLEGLSDIELREVGLDALTNDLLYSAFHDILVTAINDAKARTQVVAA